jgi:hypothetical protein
MDRDGLITIQSQYTPKDTMQQLEAGVKAKGMTVFAPCRWRRRGWYGLASHRPRDLRQPERRGRVFVFRRKIRLFQQHPPIADAR